MCTSELLYSEQELKTFLQEGQFKLSNYSYNGNSLTAYCLHCTINWKCNTSRSNAFRSKYRNTKPLFQLVFLNISVSGQTTCNQWFSSPVEYLPISFQKSGKINLQDSSVQDCSPPVIQNNCNGQINAHLGILCVKVNKSGHAHSYIYELRQQWKYILNHHD